MRATFGWLFYTLNRQMDVVNVYLCSILFNMNTTTFISSYIDYFLAVRSVNLESITYANQSYADQAVFMAQQDHFLPGFVLPALIALAIVAWRLRSREGVSMPCSMRSALLWTVLATLCSFAYYLTGATGFTSVEIGPVLSIVLIVSELLRYMRLAPGERFVPRLDAASMFVITYLQLLFADVVVSVGGGMGITWLGGVGLNDALIRTPLVVAAFTGLAMMLMKALRDRDLAAADNRGALVA